VSFGRSLGGIGSVERFIGPGLGTPELAHRCHKNQRNQRQDGEDHGDGESDAKLEHIFGGEEQASPSNRSSDQKSHAGASRGNQPVTRAAERSAFGHAGRRVD
jgi:hypothetical protein